MKKLFLLLSAGILLCACSVDNDSAKRTSLADIFADAKEKETFSAKKEESKELKDEDLAQWENIKAEVKSVNGYTGTENLLTNSMLIGAYMAEEYGYTPEEINKYLKMDLYIDNPYCDDEFAAFEVLKVNENYAMAKGCKTLTADDVCGDNGKERKFVFPKQVGNINYMYFDNEVIKPEQNRCVVYAGSFVYTDKEGTHTLPVAVFESKKIMLPKFIRLSESRLGIYDEKIFK